MISQRRSFQLLGTFPKFTIHVMLPFRGVRGMSLWKVRQNCLTFHHEPSYKTVGARLAWKVIVGY